MRGLALGDAYFRIKLFHLRHGCHSMDPTTWAAFWLYSIWVHEPIELDQPPFGTNMAFQKKMFEKHGGFRLDLGPRPGSELRNEDTEFGRRLLAAGERLRYEPSAKVYHRVPEERLTTGYFLKFCFDHGRAFHSRDWKASRPLGDSSALSDTAEDRNAVCCKVAALDVDQLESQTEVLSQSDGMDDGGRNRGGLVSVARRRETNRQSLCQTQRDNCILERDADREL